MWTTHQRIFLLLFIVLCIHKINEPLPTSYIINYCILNEHFSHSHTHRFASEERISQKRVRHPDTQWIRRWDEKKDLSKKNSGTNYCKTNNVHGKTFATNWTCIHVVSYYFIPFWFIFCGWRARICNTLKFIFLNLYHAMTNRNRQEKRARKKEKNGIANHSSQQIVWMEGKKQLAFCRGHKHIRSAVYQV